MTDNQIRAWLASSDTEVSLDEQIQLSDCLTELLAHRELHRSIKYAVWVRDQSAESGWTMFGAFQSKERADDYASDLDAYELAPYGLLVLPFQEFPCLTAR